MGFKVEPAVFVMRGPFLPLPHPSLAVDVAAAARGLAVAVPEDPREGGGGLRVDDDRLLLIMRSASCLWRSNTSSSFLLGIVDEWYVFIMSPLLVVLC